jgi:hypothetical protein
MPRLSWPTLFEMDVALKLDAVNVPSGKRAAALRWRINPWLGIPRQPLKVFSRAKSFAMPQYGLPFFTGNSLIPFPMVQEWGRTPLMEVIVSLTPNVGQTITIQALDHRLELITGESVSVSRPFSTTSVPIKARLRAPNICAILLTGGTGSLQRIDGTTMDAFISDSRWVLQETVGLPFAANEVTPAVYNTAAIQGKSNGHLGSVAAIERLTEAKSIYTPPPTSRPSGTIAITWIEPTPNDVMSELKTGSNSLWAHLKQMLIDTAPGSPQQNTPQMDYRGSVTVASFRQPGQPDDPNQPGRMDLGIAGLTILAAATDPWTALGLGFGTTMFPTEVTPPDVPRIIADEVGLVGVAAADVSLAPITLPEIDSDYMVTGQFKLSTTNTVELAAVGSLVRFAVAPPIQLMATTARRHRPMVRDQASSEDVELTWQRVGGSLRPHQYALGIQVDNTLSVLNAARPGFNTGFIPYVPSLRLDGVPESQSTVSFVDNVRPVPLTGQRTDTYMVAAQDVFGRWSTWAEAGHIIKADPPPTPPLLLGASIALKNPKGVGRQVISDVEITFAWDWADRSPRLMEFVGRFFDASQSPPTTIPKGMSTTPVPTGLEAPITLQFNTITNPPVSTPSGGPSVVLLAVQPGDGDVRRYKMTMSGVTLDFGAASRLAFAAWARVTLAVDAPFNSFGPYAGPVVARTNDPLPAAAPTVVPEINWTALPDAMGIARASLKFPVVPLAAGYVVYEASEAAILSALGQPQPPKSGVGSSIGERAIKLKSVAGQTGAMDAFARLRTQNLKSPAVEIELPGATDGLYAYTFTSVTKENVESPRSAVTLVAVPRRTVPGVPSLRVKPEGAGVRVRVVPGSGPPPARIALHRTTSTATLSDVDLMGPPLKDGGVPPWTIEPSGAWTLFDDVAPSWRPYYYRAAAIGAEDAVNGKRAGRSGPSAVLDVLVPPTTPPDLTALTVAKSPNGTLIQVQFRSSADIRISPAGGHRVQVSTIDRTGPVPKETVSAQGTLSTLAMRANPPVQAVGAITRGDRDTTGRYMYEAFVPFGAQEALVRMIDPLGRSSVLRVALEPDLVGLLASSAQATITAFVKSNSPITAPPSGAFVLELFQELADPTKPTIKLVTSAALHTISTTPVPGQFWRSGPDADGRFTYSCTFGFSPGVVIDSVSARLTNPLGGQRELFAPVVSGGGVEI